MAISIGKSEEGMSRPKPPARRARLTVNEENQLNKSVHLFRRELEKESVSLRRTPWRENRSKVEFNLLLGVTSESSPKIDEVLNRGCVDVRHTGEIEDDSLK